MGCFNCTDKYRDWYKNHPGIQRSEINSFCNCLSTSPCSHLPLALHLNPHFPASAWQRLLPSVGPGDLLPTGPASCTTGALWEDQKGDATIDLVLAGKRGFVLFGATLTSAYSSFAGNQKAAQLSVVLPLLTHRCFILAQHTVCFLPGGAVTSPFDLPYIRFWLCTSYFL